jgi:hypothetical protein
MRLTAAALTIVVSAVLAVPSSAAGPGDLTIVSKATSPRGTNRTLTMYLSSDRMRMAGEDRDTIVDLPSGRVTTIDDRRKEYSETSLADLRAFSEQLDSAMEGRDVFDRSVSATATVTVEKGTGTRQIAGYEARPYTLAMGDVMRVEVWAAPALKPPAGYYDARKAAYAAMGPMGRRFQRVFEAMKGVDGLPLAMSVDYRMRAVRREFSVEATEVRKGAVPDAVFKAPPEYRKVESAFGGPGRTGRREPSPAPSRRP